MTSKANEKEFLHPILERMVAEDLLSRELAEEVCEGARRHNPLLGEVLLSAGILRMGQLMKILERQACDPGARLGEVAVELAFCTEADVRWGLAKQAEQSRHPLEELHGRGLVSEGALLQFLVGLLKRCEKLAAGGFSSAAFWSEPAADEAARAAEPANTEGDAPGDVGKVPPIAMSS